MQKQNMYLFLMHHSSQVCINFISVKNKTSESHLTPSIFKVKQQIFMRLFFFFLILKFCSYQIRLANVGCSCCWWNRCSCWFVHYIIIFFRSHDPIKPTLLLSIFFLATMLISITTPAQPSHNKIWACIFDENVCASQNFKWYLFFNLLFFCTCFMYMFLFFGGLFAFMVLISSRRRDHRLLLGLLDVNV